MAVKKGYGISIVDKNKEEGRQLLKSTTLYQDDVESVGGIGNYVESIDSLLKENEALEIGPFWYE